MFNLNYLMTQKTLKIYILICLIAGLILPALNPARAGSLDVNSVEISDIKDNTALISWMTEVPTKGIIYYGLNPEKLDQNASYSALSSWHTSTLSNLTIRKTYYYSITSYDQWGQMQETFVRSFSTSGMADTVAPKFSKVDILQTTPNAMAFSWTLSEAANISIYYARIVNGVDDGKLKYISAGTTSKSKSSTSFVYNLTPDSSYWLKLIAKDSGKNQTEYWARFYTGLGDAKTKIPVKIYNVKPMSFDSARITTEQATISWSTNWVATTKISYGTKSKSYGKSIEINKNALARDHQVTLTGLKANTTYYYKITAYNSFYGKTVTSEEFSFRTASKVTYQMQTVIPQKAFSVDTDNDGLSDGYEISIGTDIYNYDTDADGMLDGTEIKLGYDPKVKNGTLDPAYYSQPRFSAIVEKQKSDELSAIIKKNFGKINFSEANWKTLSNSYIYGGYPVEAILRAVELGGKTVHPTKPWSEWKNSDTYKQYMKVK